MRILSSNGRIRRENVTKIKINDVLDQAKFLLDPFCIDCQHDSDSARVDLNYWVLKPTNSSLLLLNQPTSLSLLLHYQSHVDNRCNQTLLGRKYIFS